MELLHHIRCGKAGKTLTVTGKFRRLLHVYMEFVLSQAARLIQILSKQSVCSITVQIKYRKFH
jgi:hypothetical protein